MNLDEFAFINHQLAGMLRAGIPLEGGLRQLAESMKRGRLRDELRALENDLTQGVSLEKALDKRSLPALYIALLKVGVRANDLPGMMTTLGDHYGRTHAIWTRLKGLMTYPVIVLVVALACSLFVAIGLGGFYEELMFDADMDHIAAWEPARIMLWVPPLGLLLTLAGFTFILTYAPLRRLATWRLDAFRDARLAQLAGAFAALIRGGSTLGEAATIAKEIEGDSVGGRELKVWQTRMEAGAAKFPQVAGGGKAFPPLFVWLVAGAGEDLAQGFEQARKIYFERANRRCDTLLFSALPAAVVMLGFLVLSQFVPFFLYLTHMMDMFSI